MFFSYDTGTFQMAASVLSLSLCMGPLKVESPFPTTLWFSWSLALLIVKAP